MTVNLYRMCSAQLLSLSFILIGGLIHASVVSVIAAKYSSLMVHCVTAVCPRECLQCLLMLRRRCETSIVTHKQYCVEIILYSKFDASEPVWNILADRLFLQVFPVCQIV